MRKTSLVNGKKWDSSHFDILRDEYLNIRDDLLGKASEKKLDEYLKKHCGLARKT